MQSSVMLPSVRPLLQCRQTDLLSSSLSPFPPTDPSITADRRANSAQNSSHWPHWPSSHLHFHLNLLKTYYSSSTLERKWKSKQMTCELWVTTLDSTEVIIMSSQSVCESQRLQCMSKQWECWFNDVCEKQSHCRVWALRRSVRWHWGNPTLCLAKGEVGERSDLSAGECHTGKCGAQPAVWKDNCFAKRSVRDVDGDKEKKNEASEYYTRRKMRLIRSLLMFAGGIAVQQWKCADSFRM